MNDQQRDEAVFKAISSYTAKNTTSKGAARSALINEGIYTKAGKLRAEFGGSKKEK